MLGLKLSSSSCLLMAFFTSGQGMPTVMCLHVFCLGPNLMQRGVSAREAEAKVTRLKVISVKHQAPLAIKGSDVSVYEGERKNEDVLI